MGERALAHKKGAEHAKQRAKIGRPKKTLAGIKQVAEEKYPQVVGPHTEMMVPAFQLPALMEMDKALEVFLKNVCPTGFLLYGYRYESESGVFFALGTDKQG